jgi:hypothetical protein
MRSTPVAIGYVRKHVSGVSQQWDENRIRGLAKRLGYTLSKTVAFGPTAAAPVEQLLQVVARADADAIITPGVAHFDGDIPASLVEVCDVITVDPENTYARWASYLPPTPPEGWPTETGNASEA